MSKENKDFISEIKDIIKEGVAYGYWNKKAAKSFFGKPVEKVVIDNFQKEHNIVLPESYIRFLTELGESYEGYNTHFYPLGCKAYEVYKSENGKVMLDHTHSPAEWIEFMKKYEALEHTDIDSEEYNVRVNAWVDELLAGSVVFATPGCTMFYVLMCEGAAKGEVFCLDWDYLFDVGYDEEPPCEGKFEDWVLENFQKILRMWKD